ncbi:prepilin-type N-terminal cleavage/methylation domain-containing protein [Patescibacteria group bacterium]|nr:prepilin-type N-terminal cleavage/methylation domain-containing protein [Patescibacteria group bacterium]
MNCGNKVQTKLDASGFTLVEVMIAVAVLSIGLLGAANLITYNISNSAKAINKTIATNLAQEGIELARNIRDTNWFSGSSWDNNLVQGLGNIRRIKFFCGGLINQNINPAPANIDACGAACRVYTYIKISDGSKCYSDDFGNRAGYNAPQATDFYRLIILDKLDANSILATANIKWLERGDARYLTTQEILYNWR